MTFSILDDSETGTYTVSTSEVMTGHNMIFNMYCQYCLSYKRGGWCRTNREYVRRKFTCAYWRSKEDKHDES